MPQSGTAIHAACNLPAKICGALIALATSPASGPKKGRYMIMQNRQEKHRCGIACDRTRIFAEKSHKDRNGFITVVHTICSSGDSVHGKLKQDGSFGSSAQLLGCSPARLNH